MNSKLINLTYEVELQAGEKLTLPDHLVQQDIQDYLAEKQAKSQR